MCFRVMLQGFLAVFGAFAALEAAADSPARVDVVEWPSSHASPPYAVSSDWKGGLQAFQTALGFMPEDVLVQAVFSQSAWLGVPPASVKELLPKLASRYARVKADPAFQKTPSALPYCFADHKPVMGRATMYRPPGSSDQTRVLIFMHGTGGSFLWYQQWLAEVLPDWIIICPAWGVEPARVPAEYLREAFLAAAKHCGHSLRKPVLAGLSAGGFGVARAAGGRAHLYEQVWLLAAYPPGDALLTAKNTPAIKLLAGEKEVFARDGTLTRSLAALKTRGIPVEAELIAGGDHFFLLTHPNETGKWLLRNLR